MISPFIGDMGVQAQVVWVYGQPIGLAGRDIPRPMSGKVPGPVPRYYTRDRTDIFLLHGDGRSRDQGLPRGSRAIYSTY